MTDKSNSNKKSELGFDEFMSESNFPANERKFKDVSGMFHEAGEEIVTGIRADFEPELPRLTYQYTYLDDDGVKQTVVKEWNTVAQRTLEGINKRKKEMAERYKSDRGRLWALLIAVISKPVTDTLKINYKDELDTARVTHDTLTLWGLIRKACVRLARTKVRELEDAYNAVSQGSYSFTSFVVYHRDKMDALIMAGKELTDRDKALHLVDRCNAEELNKGYAKVYTADREGKKFPRYKQIVKRMSRYHLNTAQNTEVIKAKEEKQKAKKGDRRGRNRKRGRDSDDDPQEAKIKVMQAKIDSLQSTIKKQQSGALQRIDL
eukprot:gene31707-35795_t